MGRIDSGPTGVQEGRLPETSTKQGSFAVSFANLTPQAQEQACACLDMSGVLYSMDPNSDAYIIPTDQPLPFQREVIETFITNMGGTILRPTKESH